MRRIAPFIVAVSIYAFCVSCGIRPDFPEPSSSAPQDTPVESCIVLDCFINHTWFPTDNFSGIIPDEIKKHTGVALDVTIAIDNQQICALIAANNLPDLVYTSTMMDRLSTPELCYSYDELIRTYRIDWEIPAELRTNALAYSNDNNIYTVINHYAGTEDWKNVPGVPMVASMLIRQDILNKLGNPPIRTLDDLMDIYGQVKKAFPDMIPMTFDANHRFNCFKIWSGLGLAPFIEQPDGSYIMYLRDKRYKNVLRLLNTMYQKGYLLADNFAAGSAESRLLYQSGKAFSMAACTQNYNVHSQAKLCEIDPSYLSVELMPLEGSNYTVSDIGWSGTFITKNNKNPEASIKFIRWMFASEAQKLTQWGREGIDYELDENNMPVFSKDWTDAILNDSYIEIYNPWFYFGGSAIIEAKGRYAVLEPGFYEKPYRAIREKYKNLPWIIAAMPHEGEPEKEILDKINNMVEGYEAKVILSATNQDFEANFAEYMKHVEATNVERLERYMSGKIREVKKKYHP